MRLYGELAPMDADEFNMVRRLIGEGPAKNGVARSAFAGWRARARKTGQYWGEQLHEQEVRETCRVLDALESAIRTAQSELVRQRVELDALRARRESVAADVMELAGRRESDQAWLEKLTALERRARERTEAVELAEAELAERVREIEAAAEQARDDTAGAVEGAESAGAAVVKVF